MPQSCSPGAARILWKETGTGEKWPGVGEVIDVIGDDRQEREKKGVWAVNDTKPGYKTTEFWLSLLATPGYSASRAKVKSTSTGSAQAGAGLDAPLLAVIWLSVGGSAIPMCPDEPCRMRCRPKSPPFTCLP